jgi:hypothetical protein
MRQSQQLSRQPHERQRKCACSAKSADPQCGHSDITANRLSHSGSGALTVVSLDSPATFLVWCNVVTRRVMGIGRNGRVA